jgi:hypothetical protein
MMIGVRRAIEHDGESIVRDAALGGIVRRPILRGLLANGGSNHRKCAIELPQDIRFGGALRLGSTHLWSFTPTLSE